MDCDRVNAFLNRYESVLSAQMTKSLGKSIIILYSNLACSVLGTGNQQELSTDLFVTPFLTLLCKDSDAICTISIWSFVRSSICWNNYW